MMDVDSYKALRHASKLPCHGQRTRTMQRLVNMLYVLFNFLC